ncbi:helix-turn-helix transcriptional regulator [Plectonema cf. radiosum LEGE 06105]|uniref:Helix-turn-helix transcriptional regulator n=1 Tax=Plectonema cf. radiosum LEGE 06105 TaxID=945769 RepID=A0A8J7K868_9CYAN|nr:helix-turn-helix transcriptional regulator [Plectonema radiosum]MBE9216717.1 helix-turn-helix transcriptional regulator [Plectonema cf. radiosum LEGE 06105]
MDIKKPYCINQPEVGKLIRELRNSFGLSQEKFATQLGVTCLTINRWENGRSQPSPLAMEKQERLKDWDSSLTNS